jgi:hypothetical protein
MCSFFKFIRLPTFLFGILYIGKSDSYVPLNLTWRTDKSIKLQIKYDTCYTFIFMQYPSKNKHSKFKYIQYNPEVSRPRHVCALEHTLLFYECLRPLVRTFLSHVET